MISMPVEWVAPNVFVYAQNRCDERHHSVARNRLTRLIEDGIGVVSIQVLQEGARS